MDHRSLGLGMEMRERELCLSGGWRNVTGWCLIFAISPSISDIRDSAWFAMGISLTLGWVLGLALR